jgi:hypothetical protein
MPVDDAWALLQDFSAKEFRGRAGDYVANAEARGRLRQAIDVSLPLRVIPQRGISKNMHVIVEELISPP